MWIVFLLFTLVLGFIFSKIKISIEKIKIDIKSFIFKVKVSFLWFGIIKIFNIELNQNGIKIFNKHIKYKKLINEEKLEKIKRDFKFDIKNIEKLNPKVELIRFNLKLGTEDIFITTFLVTIISVFITELFRRKLKMINLKKAYYKILPEFNKNEIFYEGKTLVSIKTMNIFKSLRQ